MRLSEGHNTLEHVVFREDERVLDIVQKKILNEGYLGHIGVQEGLLGVLLLKKNHKIILI